MKNRSCSAGVATGVTRAPARVAVSRREDAYKCGFAVAAAGSLYNACALSANTCTTCALEIIVADCVATASIHGVASDDCTRI
jgi:hypothetical protein